MQLGAETVVATKRKKKATGQPSGRRPTVHVTSKMTFNLDGQLEAELIQEHEFRAAALNDSSWTLSSTVRALLRERLAQTRVARGATQASLPLTESSTKP